jgi:hypothetical protein
MPEAAAVKLDDGVLAFRSGLLGLARTMMIDRMALPAGMVNRLIADAAQPGASWLEFAHTPQLPHVGVARAFLAAHQRALAMGARLIFCVNDQLPARELAESRRLPLYLDGVECANPPSLAIAKKDQKIAMANLPAPSLEVIQRFLARWSQLEPKQHAAIQLLTKDAITCTPPASDMAAWLCRAMIRMLDILPIVVPTSRLLAADRHGFERELQQAGLMWSHCDRCGYRLGRVGQAAGTCPSCHHAGPSIPVPDVVGRQVFMNGARLAERVCGRPKPYQDIADSTTVQLRGERAPPRLRVTGTVKVRLDDGGPDLDTINFLQAASRNSAIVRQLAAAKPDQDMLLVPPGSQELQA